MLNMCVSAQRLVHVLWFDECKVKQIFFYDQIFFANSSIKIAEALQLIICQMFM